eukprot:gnl/MRDRNA2_/MRDRNA2_86453_c0_seq2.p1 gnl/MRDRNA2_/MRDRNA2_86453_c0~~gnl/MRDRNA2_/MRDRNA2_86453_c0_seq2.p1  ORF type:complete len:207 (-),score=25.88 gnl/MRDRNA2_/MRDRNA2_86453_c0_seq2:24-644(-)
MPRKIKILDITAESNENNPINDDVEVVKQEEPVVETEPKNEEIVEETITPEGQQPQEPQEQPTEIIEETKATRVQELVKCPKCGKMITEKTMKYFHECTKNDTVKAKRRPKKIEVKKNDDARPTFMEVKDIEDIEPPTPPPQKIKLERQTNQIVEQGEKFLKSLSTDKIDYTPKVEIAYEDMRKERIKQRIQQRSIKINSLFANAI